MRQQPNQNPWNRDLQKLIETGRSASGKALYADQGLPDVSLRLHHQSEPKLNRPVDPVSNKATKWTQGLVSALIAYLIPRQVFLDFPQFYGKYQGIVKKAVPTSSPSHWRLQPKWSPLQSWNHSPIPSHPSLSQPPDILPNKVFLVRRLTSWRKALPVRATALAELISLSLFKCKCAVFKFRPRVFYTGMV